MQEQGGEVRRLERAPGERYRTADGPGAGAMAAGGLVLGLLADSLRAYALGGVLLPWEYLLARFGWVAPGSILLASLAGAFRGR